MSYINKASSEASDDDASLDAFCVQSAPNGASRSRQSQGKQERKSLYAVVKDRSGLDTRACKADGASRASEGGERKRRKKR